MQMERSPGFQSESRNCIMLLMMLQDAVSCDLVLVKPQQSKKHMYLEECFHLNFHRPFILSEEVAQLHGSRKSQQHKYPRNDSAYLCPYLTASLFPLVTTHVNFMLFIIEFAVSCKQCGCSHCSSCPHLKWTIFRYCYLAVWQLFISHSYMASRSFQFYNGVGWHHQGLLKSLL